MAEKTQKPASLSVELTSDEVKRIVSRRPEGEWVMHSDNFFEDGGQRGTKKCSCHNMSH